MTGEGTIADVVGSEAAMDRFAAAPTRCGPAAAVAKNLTVSSPITRATDVPPTTLAQRSARRRWMAGLFELIVIVVHSLLEISIESPCITASDTRERQTKTAGLPSAWVFAAAAPNQNLLYCSITAPRSGKRRIKL